MLCPKNSSYFRECRRGSFLAVKFPSCPWSTVEEPLLDILGNFPLRRTSCFHLQEYLRISAPGDFPAQYSRKSALLFGIVW